MATDTDSKRNDLKEQALARIAERAIASHVDGAIDALTLSPEQRAKKAEAAAAARTRNIALAVLGAIGALIVAVIAIKLGLRLWRQFIGLSVLAGLCIACYFLLKPTWVRMKQRMTAGSEARAAAEAERHAQEALAAAKRKIDDELAALKKKT